VSLNKTLAIPQSAIYERGVGRMKRFLVVGAFASISLAVAGCVPGRSDTRPGPERERPTAELMHLYERADYFALRAALDTLPELEGPRMRLLRAVAAHAFNDPIQSNRELLELGDGVGRLPDSLRVEAYRLRYRNHLRLYEYAAAAEAARDLLELPAVDSAARAEVENEARVAQALAGAPPQRVIRRGTSEIHRLPNTRVPVQIGDSKRGYVLDTGANLSVMMRSEAEALGLEVREADVEVGTSTGSRVMADLAVAPRVRLGEVELANVAFLVLPDEALTLGDFRIPGLIGFPVIDALGEVEFRRGGVLRIPAEVPERDIQNLAMRFLMPLVRVEILDQKAVCELDTGAQQSVLFRSFFEQNRAWIEAKGHADTVRTAGVGGERRIPAYVLSDVRVVMGDTAVTLPRLPAYTEPLATTPEHSSDCRLGTDVLNAFEGYLINLQSMTLLPL
jgi:hypothetical protein